jgi:hypothetical protein
MQHIRPHRHPAAKANAPFSSETTRLSSAIRSSQVGNPAALTAPKKTSTLNTPVVAKAAPTQEKASAPQILKFYPLLEIRHILFLSPQTPSLSLDCFRHYNIAEHRSH